MPTVITQLYDKILSVLAKQAKQANTVNRHKLFTLISSVIKYHIYSRSLYQTPNKWKEQNEVYSSIATSHNVLLYLKLAHSELSRKWWTGPGCKL